MGNCTDGFIVNNHIVYIIVDIPCQPEKIHSVGKAGRLKDAGSSDSGSR